MKFKTTNPKNEPGVEDQTLVVKFCFAKATSDTTYENMSTWSECRDFLGDCIFATEVQKPVEIYGFKYNPTTHALNPDQTILGMRFPSTSLRNIFKENLLNYGNKIFCDDAFMMGDFSVEQMVGNPLTLVLRFNRLWQRTTISISLLTFYLKCLCYVHPAGTTDILESMKTNHANSKEAKYIKAYGVDLTREIKLLTENMYKIVVDQPTCYGYTLPKGETLYTSFVHNNTGFYSVSRWKNTNMFATRYLT